MRLFTLARLLWLLFLLAGGISSAAAQETTYDAKVVDAQNKNYSLNGFTISGTTVFHCRLLDTVFTLGFDKIRSLTVDAQTASPLTGYQPATFVLSDGRTAQALVDLDNYWLEGTDADFNVPIRMKLSDVVSLSLTAETAPPTTPVSPSPSPSSPPLQTPFESPSPTPTPSPAPGLPSQTSL